MIGVDVRQFNVNQQKNLKGKKIKLGNEWEGRMKPHLLARIIILVLTTETSNIYYNICQKKTE